MLGDGELDEGQVWEALMSAAHYKLDNLIAIVDFNKIQAKGPVHEIMGLEPLVDKWQAFGWQVIEIDGHDFEQILNGFYLAKNRYNAGKPIVIIAHTVKGKGVSFMENTYEWHTHAPNAQQLQDALDELQSKEEFVWKK
jgi:transketolase